MCLMIFGTSQRFIIGVELHHATTNQDINVNPCYIQCADVDQGFPHLLLDFLGAHIDHECCGHAH